MIDFNKLGVGKTSDTVFHPKDIFMSLPGKQQGKFQYLRDIQGQVFDQWFSRRAENNLVLKMNTGGGKTLVGLLILKSSLNEKKGPALYVVQDNYLVKQIIAEANSLGIPATDNPGSPRFLNGTEILVTNIYRIVNGRSVFGVGDEGSKIKIGTIVIDDAHACLGTIEDQFTLVIKSDNPVYKDVYSVFRQSLVEQCESKVIELESGDPVAYMLVPFWSWQSNVSEVSRLLITKNKSEEFGFVWPLVKERFRLSRCVISGSRIEISPHCLPIQMIPSLHHCQRKIFMTATLADDSILASHFGITDAAISNAVTPSSSGDIGDRMILMPQVINPELPDSEVKRLCLHAAKTMNVVVIVASDSRAKFWSDEADQVLKSENIYAGVEKLKSGRVGLTVLVNRYDGIDLPQNACRLLVIDGVPDARSLIDKVEQGVLLGSDRVSNGVIQRIEQGMGRGVRASDDFCAVLLMGRSLVSRLYAEDAQSKFSPGTRAQIQLSDQVSSQIANGNIVDIWKILAYCLGQETEWVSISKGALTSLPPIATKPADDVIIGIRNAYDLASINNFRAASDAIFKVSIRPDVLLRGYLKQCAAEYVNLYDQVEAQRIMLSAAGDNPRVIKPIDGIGYHKLEGVAMDQARSCKEFFQNIGGPNAIIVKLHGVVENLIFKPETSNKFEEAFKDIASYIGFSSQRPENEFKRGPDVLWALGGLQYFVIECKNGATTSPINKHDCNQLNGSCEWFVNEYDASCTFTPILVHPFSNFEYAASPKANTRIITTGELELLCKSIENFVKSICTNNQISDEASIRERLIHFKLRAVDFCQNYTRNISAK